MKVYVYEDVDGLTSNWHDGGGLVIITDRKPEDVWTDSVLPEPSLILGTDATEERVFVFPDSGCC